jgi:hypothetical protein
MILDFKVMQYMKENKIQRDITAHIKELALLKYEDELRREDSLINQASQMQTAFSFTSAALFMVAAIALEYREPWSYDFLLTVFSTITIALVVSLVLATLAQKRYERQDFPHIEVLKEFVVENYEDSLSEAQRNIQWIDMVGKVEKDLSRVNDNKVVLIRWSMRWFYIALTLMLIWFLVAIVKM